MVHPPLMGFHTYGPPPLVTLDVTIDGGVRETGEVEVGDVRTDFPRVERSVSFSPQISGTPILIRYRFIVTVGSYTHIFCSWTFSFSSFILLPSFSFPCLETSFFFFSFFVMTSCHFDFYLSSGARSPPI